MNAIVSKFNDLAMPDPKFFPDKLERQHQFQRNRTFFIILLTVLITIIYQVYFNVYLKNQPIGFSYYCYAFLFLSVFVGFCWTKHHNPQIFKIFYAIELSIVGPLCVYLDKETGIQGGWATVHLSPLLLLLFCDSEKLYFSLVGIQMFFLEVFYRDQMIKYIDTKMTSVYVNEMLNSTTLIVLSQAFIMFKLTKMLEKSFRQELILEEKKRKDLEVQKTFILSFSHEIRNLINTLIGNIQLSLLEELAPKVKSCLEEAEIGASLLIQLINNILDSGNLDVGELEMNPTPGLVHNTLEKMWSMCGHVLKTKNLKGQLRISKDLPKTLKMDHARFMQILINLITNAVKSTQQGSVDIKIEWIRGSKYITDESFLPVPFDDENEGLFEKNLAFTALSNEFKILGIGQKKWNPDRDNTTHETGPGILKIMVTDTGYGVPFQNLPHIFDRFSDQSFGDSSVKRLGTTIGLYVTKQLSNKMEGDIKVFSKVNKGTSFIVCLPAEQVMDRSNSFNINRLQEKNLKAMIVDDLNFNIVVITSYLQRMKVEIANTAGDGSEAYNKYVQSVTSGNPFDIVTMDVEMPVMDGKESAKKIRAYERENNLKPCLLIMVSGNVCESEISQCLRHEGKELANHFLKKPATFDDIFRVISEHFRFEK